MSGRSQFSIRFLLLLMVAVGVSAATFRLEPSRQTNFAIAWLTVLFASGAIVGAVQTRGTVQAFWIGTCVVLCIAVLVEITTLWTILMWDGSGFRLEPSAAPVKLASIWCAAPVNGLFAAFLRWLLSSRREPLRFSDRGYAIVLALLVATFLGGMRFGEWREADRRDREEKAAMDEEADTEDPATP